MIIIVIVILYDFSAGQTTVKNISLKLIIKISQVIK